ncbi:hypothetical protein TNCV_2296271 [Trichonephila clavipes]|nr:hypothetical protein TNCV_2296271 [Trichonephila clavipes]
MADFRSWTPLPCKHFLFVFGIFFGTNDANSDSDRQFSSKIRINHMPLPGGEIPNHFKRVKRKSESLKAVESALQYFEQQRASVMDLLSIRLLRDEAAVRRVPSERQQDIVHLFKKRSLFCEVCYLMVVTRTPLRMQRDIEDVSSELDSGVEDYIS